MKDEPNTTKQGGPPQPVQEDSDLRIARYAAGLADYINAAGMPPAVTVLVLKSTLQEAQQLLDQAVAAQLAAKQAQTEPGHKPQKEESNVQQNKA